jgi:hypothetical protein
MDSVALSDDCATSCVLATANKVQRCYWRKLGRLACIGSAVINRTVQPGTQNSQTNSSTNC